MTSFEDITNTISSTIDNGEIENVHIAPIGDFSGSDAKGNPIPEHITKEALQQLADNLNNSGEEVLMDVDHKSAKPGVDKDTAAVGWFHRFVVDPIKGLFASLKLTKMGKELLENREYRFTSPTFVLNEDGEPVVLHSVAATNLPAFKGHISPILNSEATELTNSQESVTDMNKDELIALIKETVIAMNAEPKKEETPAKTEETKEEVKKEEQKTEEVKKEATPEKSEGEKLAEELKKEEDPKEETKEEVKNEETPVKQEEKKEEPKEEKKEETKEEVIKLEALNSAPAPTLTPDADAWKNLHGPAFFEYVAKHNLH